MNRAPTPDPLRPYPRGLALLEHGGYLTKTFSPVSLPSPSEGHCSAGVFHNPGILPVCARPPPG